MRFAPATLVIVATASTLSACQLERLFPEDVGAGAARLIVRDAAVLAKAVDDDTTCGFDSDVVKYSPSVTGEVGEIGTVVWSVNNCTMDFGAPHVTSVDCNGDERIVGGRVTISATRTVRGLITGDAETPVVPLENDAVVVSYDASVTDFVVALSSSNNVGTIRSGRVQFNADVHLARSASMGVCAVDTSEVTINTIRVDDAVVTVDTGDSAFDVDVPAANIFAQLGEWEGRENVIGGAITVWDTGVDLKTAGSDGDTLDPDYDRETFRASYACKADLLVPQDYACPDLKETVVSGAARLLLNNAGNAVQAAVSDARCGFASPGVVSAVRLTGETGYDGGEAVFTIDSPCAIELPELTTLSRTCQGQETKGEGRVLVRGTMRQRGRLTGDPTQPIIPTSRDAVEIVFDVSFDGWSVGNGDPGGKVFVADAGGVTGRMRPRLAKDESTGACSIPTPVVTFDNLAIKPGTTGLLRSGALAVRVDVDAGTLNAQVGNKDGVENTLAGTISATLLGEDVSIDVGGELDPDYDAGLAVAAFSCTPYLKIPVSDDECSFDAVIAENSARLAVQTAGNLASMINADDSCGFEDTLGVLLWPSEVIGSSGEMGSMSWDVVDCGIERADNTRMSSDCLGGETFVEGFADFVDVGRTVRGEREKMLLGVLVDSIVPREEDAVDVFMREVQLSEFATWSVAAGADAPAGVLVIHEGTLSATVQPALGARADDPETVDVPTPVARISSLHLSGDATLFAQGKTFHFRIDDADLLATNGAFMGAENSLSGAISIDGERHDVHAALNPDYDASAFDNGYSCNEVLLAPVR